MKKIISILAIVSLMICSCRPKTTNYPDEMVETIESCNDVWAGTELSLSLVKSDCDLVGGAVDCTMTTVIDKKVVKYPIEVCIFKNDRDLLSNRKLVEAWIRQINEEIAKTHPKTYDEFHQKLYELDISWKPVKEGMIALYRFYGSVTNTGIYIYCKDNCIGIFEIHNFYNSPRGHLNNLEHVEGIFKEFEK